MRTRADTDRAVVLATESNEPSEEAAPLTRAERIHAMRESLEAESRRADSVASLEPTPRERVAAPRSRNDPRLEAREMLRELEEIAGAFGLPRSNSRSSSAPELRTPTSEPVCDPRGPRGRSLWGEPSPYLEERMGGARVAAADLGKALGEIAERSGQLRVTVATLEDQLHRASREIQFLRTDDAVPAPMPLPSAPVGAETATVVRSRPRVTIAPNVSAPPADAESTTEAPFARYTTERYNRSVGILGDQRTKIGATMVVLATAISAVLLVVTFLSHEPTPSAFVAGLPMIWMIPVPFFVVSFRGTQRVLRTHPMNLEGGL